MPPVSWPWLAEPTTSLLLSHCSQPALCPGPQTAWLAAVAAIAFQVVQPAGNPSVTPDCSIIPSEINLFFFFKFKTSSSCNTQRFVIDDFFLKSLINRKTSRHPLTPKHSCNRENLSGHHWGSGFSLSLPLQNTRLDQPYLLLFRHFYLSWPKEGTPFQWNL